MAEDRLSGVMLLKHANPYVREVARELLIASGEEGITALREALYCQDGYLSLAAAHMLMECDEQLRFAAMCEALKSPNPLVGDLAVRALKRYGDRSIDTLLEALEEAHLLVQVAIVCVLEHISSQQAVCPLMELLAVSDSSTLRYTIIQALGVIGDQAALEAIRSYANDPDDHVRKRVKQALSRLEANPQGTDQAEVGRQK